jgi:hypothetical protein
MAAVRRCEDIPGRTNRHGHRYPDDPDAADGHHEDMGRAHAVVKGPVAGTATEISTPDRSLGDPGRPIGRRPPFLLGRSATTGVVITAGAPRLVPVSPGTLGPGGPGIAVGQAPLLSWPPRHGLRGGAAVTIALLGALGSIVGITLTAQAPRHGHSRSPGRRNDRLGIRRRPRQPLPAPSPERVPGPLGTGGAVLGTLDGLLVPRARPLADLPRFRPGRYRPTPSSHRPRAVPLCDGVVAKVATSVLATLLVSLIAGAWAVAWFVSLGVPYPVSLAILGAAPGPISVVRSTAGEAAGILMALTVAPVRVATIGFFVVYRSVEGHLLVPDIIGRAVSPSTDRP